MPEPTGLSQAEAARRLAAEGPNVLEKARRRTLARRLFDLLKQPMFALLVVAAALYTLLGDVTEGLTLAVFVLAVIGLTFYQEGRTENAIEALRELTETRARVLGVPHLQRGRRQGRAGPHRGRQPAGRRPPPAHPGAELRGGAGLPGGDRHHHR